MNMDIHLKKNFHILSIISFISILMISKMGDVSQKDKSGYLLHDRNHNY